MKLFFPQPLGLIDVAVDRAVLQDDGDVILIGTYKGRERSARLTAAEVDLIVDQVAAEDEPGEQPAEGAQS